MTQRPQTPCRICNIISMYFSKRLLLWLSGVASAGADLSLWGVIMKCIRGSSWSVSVDIMSDTMFTVNTGHHRVWSAVTQTTTRPSPPAPRPGIGQRRPLPSSDWSVISLRSRISRMICPEMRGMRAALAGTGVVTWNESFTSNIN